MKEIKNCPLCSQAVFTKLFLAREYIFFSKEKFQLVCCNNCGLVFLNPQPSEEELQKFYPVELFSEKTDSFRARSPQIMLLNKLKEATRFHKKGALLDIGCGPGYFLHLMKERGWEVFGLDLSKSACDLAAKRVGSKSIFFGDLNSTELPLKKYDLITLWHVIEHLHQPKRTLERIRGLLKDDGLLIICCPNFGSLLRVIFRENWFPLVVPHHLFHYSQRTLKAMLKECGFKIRYRKRHFIDPFLNFGSLKESLMRFFGLGEMTAMLPLSKPRLTAADHKRNLAWVVIRNAFNYVCIAVSLFLSLCGNEESILVWAEIEKK